MASAAPAAGAATGPAFLSVNNIEVVYSHVILVLKGVSLSVPKGSITALLGGNARAQYLFALGILAVTVAVSLAVRLTRLHHAFSAIRQGEETARVLVVQRM